MMIKDKTIHVRGNAVNEKGLVEFRFGLGGLLEDGGLPLDDFLEAIRVVSANEVLIDPEIVVSTEDEGDWGETSCILRGWKTPDPWLQKEIDKRRAQIKVQFEKARERTNEVQHKKEEKERAQYERLKERFG